MSKKVKMPTRAAVRVPTILTYIEGSLTIAKKHADPSAASKLDYAIAACERAHGNWKVIGDPLMVSMESMMQIGLINKELDKIWWLKEKEDMNLPGMCYTGICLLDDLMSLIKDDRKTRWLQDIYDGIVAVISQVDPEGEMYLTQDRANEIVQAIYSVVGES